MRSGHAGQRTGGRAARAASVLQGGGVRDPSCQGPSSGLPPQAGALPFAVPSLPPPARLRSTGSRGRRVARLADRPRGHGRTFLGPSGTPASPVLRVFDWASLLRAWGPPRTTVTARACPPMSPGGGSLPNAFRVAARHGGVQWDFLPGKRIQDGTAASHSSPSLAHACLSLAQPEILSPLARKHALAHPFLHPRLGWTLPAKFSFPHCSLTYPQRTSCEGTFFEPLHPHVSFLHLNLFIPPPNACEGAGLPFCRRYLPHLLSLSFQSVCMILLVHTHTFTSINTSIK